MASLEDCEVCRGTAGDEMACLEGDLTDGDDPVTAVDFFVGFD
jgi:hypothetical protein